MCDACWRMAGIPQMRDSDALLYIISRAISILSRSFSTFSTASPASSPCPHRHSLPDWACAGVRLCVLWLDRANHSADRVGRQPVR